MKLMGLSRLTAFVQRCDDARAGAIAALIAELSAGTWQSISEMANAFPSATVHGFQVRIRLDGACEIALRADCTTQMVLIEYVGVAIGARDDKRGKKAA